MAMNRVQFQPGLSMAEFFERYGSEDQCEAALFAARWPSGWRCPRCECAWHSSFVREGRRYWQCSAHGHQSSLTSGTVFEATKLPLKRWFLAMHFLTQAKNNVPLPSPALSRGGSYSQLRFVANQVPRCHSLSHRRPNPRVAASGALLEAESPTPLDAKRYTRVPACKWHLSWSPITLVHGRPLFHPMAILNLHDRRALEESVTSMDAEALAATVQQGGLSQLAETVAMAELARRVLVDEVDYGPSARSRTARLLDRASVLAAALAFAVWVAWVLGVVT